MPTFLLQVFLQYFQLHPTTWPALKEQETPQGTQLSPKPRAQQQKGRVITKLVTASMMYSHAMTRRYR